MSWDCNSFKAPLSASYLNALNLSQQRYLQTRLTKYLYVISKLPGAWWYLSSGTASWERDCARIVTYCYCAFVARARFSRHLVGGKVVSETLIIANKTPTFRQCCLHQGKPFSRHSNGIQTKSVTQRIEIKALDWLFRNEAIIALKKKKLKKAPVLRDQIFGHLIIYNDHISNCFIFLNL